jgi:hypothetical protein
VPHARAHTHKHTSTHPRPHTPIPAALERLRGRNAALEAERAKTINAAQRSSDRWRDRAVISTTNRNLVGLAAVQQEYEALIDGLVARMDALEPRPFAENPEEAEILALYRRFQPHYPDRHLFRSPLGPLWELVRNMLRAMVDGPLPPSHVFIKYLRWVFHKCHFNPTDFRWQDRSTVLSDDPDVRRLQHDAEWGTGGCVPDTIK